MACLHPVATSGAEQVRRRCGVRGSCTLSRRTQRTRVAPEERTRAVARARQVGPTVTAREFGLSPNTVKSWLRRAPEVDEADVDVVALEARVDAYDDAELAAAHRLAFDHLTAAIRRGDA